MDEGLEMRLHHNNILQDAAHRPFCTNRIRRSTRRGTLDRFVLLNVEGHLSTLGLALLFDVLSRVQCYPVFGPYSFQAKRKGVDQNMVCTFLYSTRLQVLCMLTARLGSCSYFTPCTFVPAF